MGAIDREGNVSWVGVGPDCIEREEGRTGSQEGRRQCPRKLKVEDGLESPDNDGKTESRYP